MKRGKKEIMKDEKRPCKSMTKDGAPCQTPALAGSDFCFFHDPDKAEERFEARRAGGRQNRMKTLPAEMPDVNVESCQDVVRLISETINQVRKGDIDPRVANAIGYLANVLIRAVDQGELEKRIEDLEAAVSMKTASPDHYLTRMES
jgi:hypothetical protein